MRIEPSINGNNLLQVLSDSTEQISESVKRLGPLWDKLCEVFQERHARVKKS